MKLQAFSSRENIIWAAGLFEGEGWISIQGYTPAIGIQSSDKDVLDRFAAAVGGGPIYTRKNRIYVYEHIRTRKQQYAWRVGGFENAQAILVMLWPWLGLRRKIRIQEVLSVVKQAPKVSYKGCPQEPRITREHGEHQKYWQGCRCDLCKNAGYEYNKNRRLLLQAKAPRINRSYCKR